MDRISRFSPKVQKFLGYVGIFVGFISMIFIFVLVVYGTLKFVLVPGTAPALAPVLPGVKIDGAPDLSFWHWVISIFIVAVIHEFSHGLVARLHNIKVKSSGFAFLGPILAAFVEPDEKEMSKKSKMQQLSVFAAGPFSNIVFAGFVLLFMIFLMGPFLNTVYADNGVIVNSVMEDSSVSSIEAPFTIYSMDGVETLGVIDLLNESLNLKPGDSVVLGTDKGEYKVIVGSNPKNDSLAYFGMAGLEQDSVLEEEYIYLEKYEGVIDWVKLLVIWLFLISFGIGLFNLLPLGPVDGGRMFLVLGTAIFNEKIAKKMLTIVSIFLLMIIIINLLPYFNQLIVGLYNLLF
ncbi:MAG: site-2 protease family protein [archaeon]